MVKLAVIIENSMEWIAEGTDVGVLHGTDYGRGATHCQGMDVSKHKLSIGRKNIEIHYKLEI